MNKSKKFTAVLAISSALLAVAANAGIIYEQRFDSNPGVGDGQPWDLLAAPSTPPTLAVGSPDSAANDESYNALGGNGGTGGVEVNRTTVGIEVERLGTTEAGLISPYGSYGPSEYFGFDFYWQDDTAATSFSGLQVYFIGSGVTWYNAVDTSGQAENTWASYTVGWDSSAAGWTDTGAPGDNFTTARANITEIGFRFLYIADAANELAFDNVGHGYSVPEPETYAMIGVALVGLCLAFRKRLTEVVGAAVRIPWAV